MTWTVRSSILAVLHLSWQESKCLLCLGSQLYGCFGAAFAETLTLHTPLQCLPPHRLIEPLCAGIPWSWKVAILGNVFLLASCSFIFLNVILIHENLARSHHFSLSLTGYCGCSEASSLSSSLQMMSDIRIYAPKLLRTKAHTLI